MNFERELSRIGHAMGTFSKPVHTERWQGVDISKRPEAAMRELKHIFLRSELPEDGTLDYYRDAIKPNLPWADNHFEERVCGQPINPGVEWANWPYAHSADKFRQPVLGPFLPSQDWAYLAGMIDGEGTIYFRDKERWQGVVRVYQRTRGVCDYLHSVFRVGKVASNNEDTKTTLPNGKEVDNHCFFWQVNALLEVRWLLTGVLPYLRIKQDKAKAAIERIQGSIDNPSNQGSPPKKVWGRDWEPRFNHNYMQRYWPRGDNDSPFLGYDGCPYGDLRDVVNQLAREPMTRQAMLPVFFPEDTGAVHGSRVPCSIAYQFFVRDGKMDVVYWLRSCDYKRHLRDDIYLTVRLLLWVLTEVRKLNAEFNNVVPGEYVMMITSLHCFINDYREMFK